MKKQSRTKSHNIYIYIYSVVFLMAATATFLYFALNGKSFIWNEDGYAQHNLALTYYGTWLRDIIRNILFEHTFSIPLWDFSLGTGSDILTTLNYYVIGEPLNLLSVFVPARYTEYLYDFLIILRLYFAGLAFMQFCRVMGRKGNGIIAGAVIYVFTGYTMFVAVRHPFFITPMIFFPLILTGVEKILKKRKPYQFIISIALCAASNFYFFYMIAILTVVYTLVRCIFIYGRQIKSMIKKLSFMLLYALTGVMISACLFLPTAMLFLEDNRQGVGFQVPFLYEFSYYQKLLTSFISADTAGYYVYMGYTPLVIVGLYYIFKKKDKQKVCLFFLSIMAVGLPVAGYFMNGMSYITNRWMWALGMLAAYIVVSYWEKILTLNTKDFYKIAVFISIYAFLICINKNTRTENALGQLFIFMLTMLILHFLKRKKVSFRKLENMAILSILFSIALNALYMYSLDEQNYISQFLDRGTAYASYQKSQSADIRKHVKDDSFYRFSSPVTEHDSSVLNDTYQTLLSGHIGVKGEYSIKLGYCDNASALFDVNGLGSYWSLGNGNMQEFITQMDNREYMTVIYHGLDDRASLLSLLSTKYYLSEKGSKQAIPYGFEKIKQIRKSAPYEYSDKNSRLYQSTKYNLYQNQYALPLGYTYDNVISRQSFDQYNSVEKEDILLKSAVVEEEDVKDMDAIENGQLIETTDVTTNTEEPDYQIECREGITFKENTFYVKQPNAQVYVSCKNQKNTELYVYLKGFQYTTSNPLNGLENSMKGLSRLDQKIITDKYKDWTSPYAIHLMFDAKTAHKRMITYREDTQLYTGRENFVINLGYDDKERNGFYITFGNEGIYHLDELKVIEKSFNHYGEEINNLKAVSLTDISLTDNTVSGQIDTDKSKLLCFSIPYNRGWSLYIDGRKSEVLKVNMVFLGAVIEPGEHTVVLKYQTPGLKWGLICSGIGIFMLLVIALVFQRKNPQNPILKKNT